MGLIPGSGQSPGGGHGNPLQYSCLENPMDRGAWWATVYGVTKNQIQPKRMSMHAPVAKGKKDSEIIEAKMATRNQQKQNEYNDHNEEQF